MIGIADPIRFMIDLTAFFSIYLMLSISLNLEYGYTGIPNFGKVLFFAGGAFIAGAVITRLLLIIIGLSSKNYCSFNVLYASEVTKYLAENPLLSILIFVTMLLAGCIVGGLLGYVASYPAIRLKETYLGITLLASGELLRIVARNYDPLICGTLGVSVPDVFAWIPASIKEFVQVLIMLGIALSTWFFVEKLTRSPLGRLIRAIRDNEIAAESYGKDVVKVRMKILVLGSAIAGIAGVLYALYVRSVHADDFMPLRTFIIWVMIIIGGVGNNIGAALGSFIYVSTERLIMQYKHYIVAPFDVNYLSYIFFGIVLILILMFKPKGLLPEKPSKTTEFEKIIKKLKKK
ncbi:MAG: branched-chain amino acid ABC transporter permease [Thermoprotei archaeon]|nr:MAG: branched-chain amino acid ABC transporter permease [Thermoprotei archaeon]